MPKVPKVPKVHVRMPYEISFSRPVAIDVHTNDGDAGEFRIRLTSQTKRLIGYKEADTPELEELRILTEGELRKWAAEYIKTERD